MSLGRERTVTANQKKCFALQGEPDTKRVTVNRGNETIKIVELHEGEITPICHTYAEEGTYRVKLPNPEGIVSLYLQEEVTHFQKGNANNLNGGNWTEEITNYGELSESTKIVEEETVPTEEEPLSTEEEETPPAEEEETPPTEEEEMMQTMGIPTPESCFTTTESGGNITITDYLVGNEGCTTVVVIPSTIGEKPVTSI